MRNRMPKLQPKPKRRLRVAEAYGKGMHPSNPAAAKAEAQLMFGRMGGRMVKPKR